MNREQIIAILKVLKVAYPRFYAEMSKKEAEDTINLWQEMFSHDKPELVTAAVKDLVNSFKFPPTIADVKDKMYELTKTDTDTPVELWNAIKKAMRNSAYNAVEEFEKLPEVAKRFVGSPNQLREWAIGTDYNDGVIKGQFFKQVEIIKQRDKDNSMMLPEVRNLVQKLSANNDMKLLG
jgi:hypothetical protein